MWGDALVIGMAQLTMTIAVDDDPNDIISLAVTAMADGFSGHARDWLSRGQLVQFAKNLAEYPISKADIACGAIVIEVAPYGALGALLVTCELGNDASPVGQRAELAFVTDYATIDRFRAALVATLSAKADCELTLHGER